MSIRGGDLSVKGILVIELPDGKGEWPGGAAALFNVPEKMAAAKGTRCLPLSPEHHNGGDLKAIVNIKDATPKIPRF